MEEDESQPRKRTSVVVLIDVLASKYHHRQVE